MSRIHFTEGPCAQHPKDYVTGIWWMVSCPTCISWVVITMSLRLVALALILNLAACDDERGQREQVREEWDGQSFAPSPSCPAPHTPEAVHYQEHGGAANAWLWWMTMHALTQPSYHETHHVVHHRYVPTYRPAPRPVVYRAATSRTRMAPAARAAPTAHAPTKPSATVPSSALKPTSPGRAPAWTAKPSSNYGYRPAPAYRPSPSKGN